jgi:SAM-dependent methyltransferase
MRFRKKDFNFYVPSLEFFKDKNVLDIASHTGESSVAICKLNAKFVTALEIREELVTQAWQLAHKEGVDNIQFVCGDATNLMLLKKLLHNIDTVTCFGMFYHIHDHFNFIKNICTSSAKYFLLETLFGIESPNPTMLCNVEKTQPITCGANLGFDHVMVGAPNLIWIKQVLDIFNWQIVFFKTDIDKYAVGAHERMNIGAVNLKYVDIKNNPTMPDHMWEWQTNTEQNGGKIFSIY